MVKTAEAPKTVVFPGVVVARVGVESHVADVAHLGVAAAVFGQRRVDSTS